MDNPRKSQGFTLVELIIVITLLGIVASFIAVMSANQMQSYVDMSARGNLVNLAESSLRRISRDIHNATPNSVRVSGNALEFVPIVSAGRYRASPSELVTSDILDFSQADSSFQVLGNSVQPASGAQIVIYNFPWVDGSGPVAGANLYGASSSGVLSPVGSHVISPAGNTITVTDNGVNDLISFNTGVRFSFSSPAKRFFVVNGAQSFICDTAAGEIRRYSGYAIQSAQPVSGAALPLSAATSATLLVDHVESCSFNYAANPSLRLGVVTIELTLVDKGERIRLVQQIQVNNRA